MRSPKAEVDVAQAGSPRRSKPVTKSPAVKATGGARVASRAKPPSRFLVVVLGPEMGDELLAPQVAQRVLELHELDEQVVLRVERRGRHRALPVERQPLLRAVHPGA